MVGPLQRLMPPTERSCIRLSIACSTAKSESAGVRLAIGMRKLMTIMNNPQGRASQRAATRQTMARGEFFAALFILSYLNGVAARAIAFAADQGWQEAIMSTFGVSLIVWLASIGGISLLLTDRSSSIRRFDISVGMICLLLIWLPIGGTSWLAMTALSLYLILTEKADSNIRRGAIILLAVSAPMFWSPMFFTAFSDLLLRIDAFLVGWLLGTESSGNMVSFLNASDFLVILPACSSFAHLSLIPLCWIALSVMVNHRPTFMDLVWCGAAIAAVVSINVVRLAIMGLNIENYRLLHSSMGDTVVNLIATSLAIGICTYGLRRELFSGI
jgi:hypothetical protein